MCSSDLVDLLIHDAQYTADEFSAKCHWGHSTIDYAVWLAEECDVRTLALFHHDPVRTDAALDDVVERFAGATNGVQVLAAHEGLVLELA